MNFVLLVSVYIHASFFNSFGSKFCSQEATKSRTIAVCLLFYSHRSSSKNARCYPLFPNF